MTIRRPLTQAETNRLVHLYLRGERVVDLASKFGIPTGVVYRIVRSPQRLPLSDVGPAGPGTAAQGIAAALRAALTEQTAGMLFPQKSAIARHFGVSNTTAYAAARILVGQGLLEPIPYRAYLIKPADAARQVETTSLDTGPDTPGPTMRG